MTSLAAAPSRRLDGFATNGCEKGGPALLTYVTKPPNPGLQAAKTCTGPNIS